jgi:putative endonuclease
MRPMHERSYFTYMMASRSHTLYIGVTGDLRKRVFQHKWKE